LRSRSKPKVIRLLGVFGGGGALDGAAGDLTIALACVAIAYGQQRPLDGDRKVENAAPNKVLAVKVAAAIPRWSSGELTVFCGR
jgi:hypothetical protein